MQKRGLGSAGGTFAQWSKARKDEERLSWSSALPLGTRSAKDTGRGPPSPGGKSAVLPAIHDLESRSGPLRQKRGVVLQQSSDVKLDTAA